LGNNPIGNAPKKLPTRSKNMRMRKFIGYSPPFSIFLIEIFNTGRKLIIERNKMVSADKEHTDSS